MMYSPFDLEHHVESRREVLLSEAAAERHAAQITRPRLLGTRAVRVRARVAGALVSLAMRLDIESVARQLAYAGASECTR
jgi:hypothetical protein